MKSRSPTDKTIDRWIKQGYGQGFGMNYKPFFYVRDVPSKGRSGIIKGLKIPREHHYLSDIEYHYHLLAEYSDRVIEIREQYALLPREETKLIANRLQIDHPVYSTRAQSVLTSDLVLTVSEGTSTTTTVLCCKAENDISPSNPKAARTLEKVLIERVYWEARNVEWRLVTDKMLPEAKVHNLDFFQGTMTCPEKDYLNGRMGNFVREALRIWNGCESLNDFLGTASLQLNLLPEECFCLLGRAIWTKVLPVDLDSRKFDFEDPLPSFKALEAPCSA